MSSTPVGAPPDSQGDFQYLPLTALFESKTNPRTFYDPQDLAELAASAKVHGIIQALIARPKNKKYEIVAGSRRFRAAKMAGLSAVPVSIRELDDQTVLEFQLVENVQRVDIHPLEAGAGYARLLDMPGYTAEVLAQKIGHDASYVTKRVSFTRLVPQLAKDFREDRIHIGHALALARLSPASQQEVLNAKVLFRETGHRIGNTFTKGDWQAIHVKELETWIATNILLDLHSAPWKKDDDTLVPRAGPCTTCPKRSSANAVLFDDLPKKELCLDHSCFREKMTAHIVRIEAAAAADGHPLVRITTNYLGETRGKELAAISLGSYHVVDKKRPCAHIELAVVVDGAGVGHTTEICRAGACKIHGHGLGAHRSEKKSFGELWAERRGGLAAKISEGTRCAVFDEIMRKTTPFEWLIPDGQLRILLDTLCRQHNGLEVPTLMGVPVDGKKPGDGYNGKLLLSHAAKLKLWELGRFVFGLTIVEAAKEFCSYDDPAFSRLETAAVLLKIDWRKAQATVTKQLTEDFERRFELAKKRNELERTRAKQPKAGAKVVRQLHAHADNANSKPARPDPRGRKHRTPKNKTGPQGMTKGTR
jgi:ParB/RepB/Spo0J family partition protein